MREQLECYWNDMSGLMRTTPLGGLSALADRLLDCQQRGSTVFICGNGGSAATATHFACDLGKGTQVPGAARFRVVSLSDNMSMLTAWANDTSYDRVFAEQLSPLVRPGDVLVVISASGNSANVVSAAHVARQADAEVIALTGRTGGRLRDVADLTVRVPSDEIEQVEDVHLIMTHSLCVALRRHAESLTLSGLDNVIGEAKVAQPD